MGVGEEMGWGIFSMDFCDSMDKFYLVVRRPMLKELCQT